MMLPNPKSEHLSIGTKVFPWGKIAAVATLKGERYYFFAEKGVAMIPGNAVEAQHLMNQMNKGRK